MANSDLRGTALGAAVLALWAVGCAAGQAAPDPDGSGAESAGFDDSGCEEGDAFRCEGTVAVSCEGDSGARLDCAEDGLICAPGVGCAVCWPGEGTCEGNVASVCRPNGSGFVQHECDVTQGMVCEPDGCKGACSWGELGDSYVGCDYHPTVTLNNGVWSGFEFAVVVSNLGEAPANVVVTRGEESITTLTVGPGALETIRLPWVEDLKGPDPNFMSQPQPPGGSRVVKTGAFRLRSDQPLAAYQFNPLDYQLDPGPAECPESSAPGCFSYSNDASLLLPAHVLGSSYYAMSWWNVGCRPGFIAVTATEDGTEVELEHGAGFAPGAGFDAQGHGVAHLDAGDVLELVGESLGGAFCFMAEGGDLSGTLVHANRPVQVIAGHGCANLPAPEINACDHLEESMFPIETLGKRYVVGYPAALEADSPYTLRIGAVSENTTIHFDPPVNEDVTLGPSSPPFELQWLEEDVEISADKPILVAQYMHGTDANVDPGVTGDPAQTLGVPVEQFRDQYTFLAPTNYLANYATLIVESGNSVSIDGQVVGAEQFQPVGSGKYAVARVLLDETGVHEARSAVAFGLTVYGYGRYTSYMYPGGLKLSAIAPVAE